MGSQPDPEATDAIATLAKAALGNATVRAHESSRPDRLFEDPYASLFQLHAEKAGVRPLPFAGDPSSARTAEYVGRLYDHVTLRTRFFDDYLLRATSEGCAQVVLVGSGFDTRPYRLDWPDDIILWEMDNAEVLSMKQDVLASPSIRPTPAAPPGR